MNEGPATHTCFIKASLNNTWLALLQVLPVTTQCWLKCGQGSSLNTEKTSALKNLLKHRLSVLFLHGPGEKNWTSALISVCLSAYSPFGDQSHPHFNHAPAKHRQTFLKLDLAIQTWKPGEGYFTDNCVAVNLINKDFTQTALTCFHTELSVSVLTRDFNLSKVYILAVLKPVDFVLSSAELPSYQIKPYGLEWLIIFSNSIYPTVLPTCVGNVLSLFCRVLSCFFFFIMATQKTKMIACKSCFVHG